MRKISLVLTLALLTGCAAMRRHPVITAAVVAIPAALVVVHYTTHNCAGMYDGKPYNGTPPCPK